MFLNEVERRYQTSLADDLRPYVGRGAFVHFGSTPKIGINTKSHHGDPAGIYCYPLDWFYKQFMASNHERGLFASDRQYWTIVELKDGAVGWTLSHMDDDTSNKIAAERQWPEWNQWSNGSIPGQKLWSYIRDADRDKNEPNSRKKELMGHINFFKGVQYIWDDGAGIIHGSEPNQILIRDPSCIAIVAAGSLRNNHRAKLGSNPNDQNHRFGFEEFLKQLRGQYGGELTWKKDIPSLTFKTRKATFSVRWSQSFNAAIAIEAQWLRTSRDLSIPEAMFHKSSMDQLLGTVSEFVNKVGMVAERGIDMFFQPNLSEQECRRVLATVVQASAFKPNTEIDNRRKSMTVSLEREVKFDRAALMCMAYINTYKDEDWYRVIIKVNGYHICDARTKDAEKLSEAVVSSFVEMTDGAKNENGNYRTFYDDEFEPFIGWAAKESGILILRERFANEIKAYEDYRLKESLYRQIDRVY